MTIYFLDNSDWSCDGASGRCFFQFPFAIFRPSTEKHVLLIDDLKNCKFEDLGDAWLLSFSYQGFDFFVDSHSHGTATSFIAVQSDCPDEILLQIIGLFSDPMIISADYEPSHPALLASPHVDFPERYFQNRYSRWIMRAMAIALAAFAFYSFRNEQYENGMGSVVGSALIFAASFCSDFKPVAS